jgi:glycylpeptide N-tetradecanoyltransferase
MQELPDVVSRVRYYHRKISVRRLVEVGFSHLPAGMTMEALEERFALPTAQRQAGLRQMEARDIPQCLRLLEEYNLKHGSQLHRVFSEEEFAHSVLPREGVVSSYVVEPAGVVSDFFSFYSVPSNIVEGGEIVGEIRNAYLYYMANTTMSRKELVNLFLICAAQDGFDVTTVLATAGLTPDCVTEEYGNRFVKGTGLLRYYLFNWQGPPMEDDEVGFLAI